MTYKEKLMQEHPGKDFKYVLDWECPSDYEYTDDIRCGAGGNCEGCWNREMTEGDGTDDEATDRSAGDACQGTRRNNDAH